jgi:hypothetical protein
MELPVLEKFQRKHVVVWKLSTNDHDVNSPRHKGWPVPGGRPAARARRTGWVATRARTVDVDNEGVMPFPPVYRPARAVVFATVCVALAVTGHTMASRAAVPPVAAAGGLALMTAVGVALAGTERSLATIFGGLLGGQFVLHALFAAAQHGQTLEHGHAMAPASSGGAMTLAHVAAAAVSAWWLRRGERAVWRLARRVASTLIRPLRALPAAPLAPGPGPYRPASSTARPRGAVLRHVVVRRGPPAPSAALA